MDKGALVTRGRRTCPECGSTMRGSVENYRFAECELKGVVLCGVTVYRCSHCGAEEVDIPNMNGLYQTLALAVIGKSTPLAPDEIKFLRKVAGFTATEFAKKMGVTRVAVSRWENGAKIGNASDQAIRAVCGFHILAELVTDGSENLSAREVMQRAKALLRAGGGDSVLRIDPALLASAPSSPDAGEIIQ